MLRPNNAGHPKLPSWERTSAASLVYQVRAARAHHRSQGQNRGTNRLSHAMGMTPMYATHYTRMSVAVRFHGYKNPSGLPPPQNTSVSRSPCRSAMARYFLTS